MAPARRLPAENRWHEVRRGLQLRRQRTADFSALVARFSLKDYELVSVPTAMLKRTARVTLKELSSEVPFVVGTNGGFFDADDTQMGLRVTRNRLLGMPRKADWGVFYTTADGVYLEHTNSVNLERLSKALFAIQCGPRIITAGRVQKLKPGKQRRTVLGFDAEKRVVLLATPSLVDLNVLAASLLKAEPQGGLALVEAMALDGGPSTGFLAALGAAPRGAAARHESPVLHDPAVWELPVLSPIADAVFVVPRGAYLWLDDLTDLTRLSGGLTAGFGDVP